MENATYGSDGGRIVRLASPGSLSLAWSADGLTWNALATGVDSHSEYGAFAVGLHGILLLENPPGAGGEADQADAGVWYLPAN